jgi:predicted MFS family arabinose efflux permease
MSATATLEEDGTPVTTARVWPLVLATMTSQALLVVLVPAITAVSEDFTTPVAAVGQARTVTAAVAITASLAITTRISAIGVPRLLVIGSVLTLTACTAVASAPGLTVFLAAHVLVGVAFACHLTAGFAGVTAFARNERARAIGRVAGANALAWIVVNPLAGGLTQWLSWRVAYGVPCGFAVAALIAARAAGPVRETRQGLPLRALVGGSARQWITAELLAYTCWTGLLTFVGAFFVEQLAVGEATAGWLLAAGAAAYVVASTRSAGLVARIPRRLLVAGSALGMAALLPALLSLERLGTATAVSVFCLIGLAAGVRTPASSGLGLDQLPGHAGAMMAIRTAVTQLGYLLGAVVGGTVIAAGGYGALGGVLSAGMAGSALLVLRVRDPAPEPRRRTFSG